MKFLVDKKIGLLFILLLIISWLYPTYFISDDWEHLDSIYKNGSNTYIKFWIYRIPSLYFSHTTLFPLFQNEYFMLANLVCWFFFFLGTLYALETFKILDRIKKESTWFFLGFFLMLSFNHTNFEFILWPSFMVNFPGYFLVILGFYLTKRFNSIWLQLLKAIFWTIGFYFTESLFFMGALLEIAYILWFQADKNLIVKFKELLKQTIIPFLLVFVSKVILTYLKPYGYAAALGFKPHLFSQTLSLIFLHDYYKVRWLTGSLALISYLAMTFWVFRDRGAKNFLKTEALFAVIILVSTSYYFIVMDYSARRAIGGQLFITWGTFCFGYLYLWFRKSECKIRKVVLILFPLCWLAHSVYVINLKLGDRSAFRRNAEVLRSRLKSEKLPVNVQRMDIMKDVNTGWNLVNKKQKSGWMRHFFNKDELKQFDYE